MITALDLFIMLCIGLIACAVIIVAAEKLIGMIDENKER